MDVLLESLPTMLRYTIIVMAGIVVMEKCRNMALQNAVERPCSRDGWLSALLVVGIAHLLGSLSPIPFSAVWWVSFTQGGDWYVIWPRLLGMSCAWFVAGWYGWHQGCKAWVK